MATFYGGPQLNSIVTLKASGSNPSYTIPAGFFAEVNVIMTGGLLSSDAITLEIEDSGVIRYRGRLEGQAATGNREDFNEDFVLDAGTVIEFFSASNTAGIATIKLFEKP